MPTWVLFALPLLFHLGLSLWIAFSTPYPSPIDERQHASYVQAMAEQPQLFPDHSRMVVRSEGAEAASANYLNHPSLYYLALAPLLDSDRSLGSQMMTLRLANVAVAGLAMAIILSAGFAILPGSTAKAVFAGALVLFPKTAPAAGLVNNDALALLATGIVFAALVRLVRCPTKGAAAVLGLGLALAGWTKLTALIMLGVAAMFVLAGISRYRPALGVRLSLAAGAVGVIGIVPTAHSLLTSGRIIWSSPVHNAVPVDQRPLLSFPQFTLHFLENLALKWPAFEPAAPIQLLSLGVLLAACTILLASVLPAIVQRKPIEPGALLAAAFVAAIPVSVAVHVAYGWSAFMAIGDLTSAQMRYYLPLWPGIALVLALAHGRIPQPRMRLVAALLAGELLLISSPAVRLFSA